LMTGWPADIHLSSKPVQLLEHRGPSPKIPNIDRRRRAPIRPGPELVEKNAKFALLQLMPAIRVVLYAGPK